MIDFSDKGSIGGRIVLFYAVLTIILGLFAFFLILKEKGFFSSVYFKALVIGIIVGISIKIGEGIYAGLSTK